MTRRETVDGVQLELERPEGWTQGAKSEWAVYARTEPGERRLGRVWRSSTPSGYYGSWRSDGIWGSSMADVLAQMVKKRGLR